MTVEQEVANLTTSVDSLTAAVNVKKATLDTSVTDSQAARDASQAARDTALTYRDAAQGHASSTSADALLASQHEDGAEQALLDAQQVAYGTDPVFDTVKVTGSIAAPGLPELDGGLGTLSAAFGQAYREIERLSGSQEANTITTLALFNLAAALGQVSDQVNGGRTELTGGSLDAPALRIGTVGIYSSAADTLSIAIGGTEVVRFTSAGLTVYGTVTQA
ncbi:hypothetical protein [Sediminimonas sp.]|uniref:hypothetical protein n=1 Tax=Sediminimonas sp. TaxID=2823379 RepID=UPI0025F51349|nr:hypothetical protein [Sediminimonas sp.]